jgi:hypothetical protein
MVPPPQFSLLPHDCADSGVEIATSATARAMHPIKRFMVSSPILNFVIA